MATVRAASKALCLIKTDALNSIGLGDTDDLQEIDLSPTATLKLEEQDVRAFQKTATTEGV